MPSLSVMLDACVLVPAVLRDALLCPAAAGLYHPRWSDAILAEVERTLVGRSMTTQARAEALIEKMRANFPEASITGYEERISAMTNHPKDRHVLAAAVAAGAQVLVTSNLRDFPAEAVAPHQIEVQSPDEFLTALLDLNPPLVLDLVRYQAESLTQPRRPLVYVLDRLSRHASIFVEHLRMAFEQAEK